MVIFAIGATQDKMEQLGRSDLMRKNGRKPTRLEKRLMEDNGYRHMEYLVVHHTTHELLIKSKDRGIPFVIKK